MLGVLEIRTYIVERVTLNVERPGFYVTVWESCFWKRGICSGNYDHCLGKLALNECLVYMETSRQAVFLRMKCRLVKLWLLFWNISFIYLFVLFIWWRIWVWGLWQLVIVNSEMMFVVNDGLFCELSFIYLLFLFVWEY